MPRAALLADRIAPYADFLSFGTNDLTQTTLAFSRDDAEGKFLTHYLEDDVLSKNPFETLDDGVRALIERTVEGARGVKPGIKLGICGEHGGDPDVDRVLQQRRARLRLVLAVPRADRAARRRTGGARTPVRIDVAFAPGVMPAAPVTVVVDVIRATTTIAHAVGQGYSRVLACGDIDRARELAGGSGTAPCSPASASA